MMHLRHFFLLPILFLLSACGFSLAEDIKPPAGSEMLPPRETPAEWVNAPVYPLVPPNPELGAPIYAEKCAPCHGERGMGDGPSAAELSVPVAALGDPKLARQRTPTDWFNIVTQGNLERFMPPFSSLTDRQRWDVVAYAFRLSETAQMIAEGEALYLANCADCHGVSGTGDGPRSAEVAVPMENFNNQDFMSQKSAANLVDAIRSGMGDDMPPFADQFSEAEYWALAAYVRSLGFAQPADKETAAMDTPVPSPEEASPVSEAEAVADAETSQSTPDQIPVGNVKVSVLDDNGNPLGQEVEVTLYAFDNMEFAYSTTQTTNPEGWSIFENVEMPTGRAFLSSADYNGVVYGSDVRTPKEFETPVELAITVYETTTDTSALVVDRLHIFFDFSIPDAVQVVELYIMRNLAEKTIVSAEEGGAVINFYLPEGAANIQFQDGQVGGRYILTDNGFADTLPIQPGEEYQLVFAYDLPYNRKLSFTRKQELSVSSAIILVPEGIKVRGENLTESGLRDLQGVNYFMYSMSTLPTGNEIVLEISGSPKGVSSLPDNRSSLLIGLGALGIAMMIAGVWLYRRDRAASDADEDENVEELDDETEETETPEELMDAIIALDDLYKAGELPEEAYEQRRALLKNRLAKALGEG
jgi:mono/diheme cytochrome c family protein